MRIFLDTANIDEIRQGVRWGVVHGITTNPSLVAKEGANFRDRVLEICDIVEGPVSAEVTATDAEGMIEQGEDISTWHPNVVVKIPTIPEGLTAIKALTDRPDPVTINATLIFSPNQGLLAALAGATYVSPFLGRLDDISHDGMAVVSDLAQIFRVQGIRSNILAASLRAPLHVVRASQVWRARRHAAVRGAGADDEAPANGHRAGAFPGRLGSQPGRGYLAAGAIARRVSGYAAVWSAMKRRMRRRISALVCRKAASRCGSATPAGSGRDQCSCRCAPGEVGQVSRALSQTVMMQSND